MKDAALTHLATALDHLDVALKDVDPRSLPHVLHHLIGARVALLAARENLGGMSACERARPRPPAQPEAERGPIVAQYACLCGGVFYSAAQFAAHRCALTGRVVVQEVSKP